MTDRVLPFAQTTEAQLATLRSILNRGQYRQDAIRESLGYDLTKPIASFEMVYVFPLLHASRPPKSPFDVLLSLFYMGYPLPRATVLQSMDSDELLALNDAGIVQAQESTVTANVRITEVGGHFVCTEPPVRTHRHGALRPSFARDAVMTFFPDTYLLANALPVGPFGRSLDICTGCGLQAINASRVCQTVEAIDINMRALGYAELNRTLNGIDNVHFRHVDLTRMEPGEAFDLITANPPFLPTASCSARFCDGGSIGDGLLRHIMGAIIPQHLAPNGVAQVVTAITRTRGQSPESRIRSLLGDAKLAVTFDTSDAPPLLSNSALDFLLFMAASQHGHDEGEMLHSMRQSAAHFAKLDIDAVDFGVLEIRRASKQDVAVCSEHGSPSRAHS